MLEVDVAKEELADKKQLEASKLQLHGELKRKIALETMLNTLDVSLDIVNCVIISSFTEAFLLPDGATAHGNDGRERKK